MTKPEPVLSTLPEQIEAAHQAAIGAARSAIANAVRCGELLLEAKAAVPHGQWLAWVDRHLSFGPRQAQKYCRLAELAGAISNAKSEFASVDEALRAMRCACDGHGDLDDVKPLHPPAPRGTADLSARRQFAQRRDEAIERLATRMHDVAGRYGAAAVAKAQNAYQVPAGNSIVDALSQVVAPYKPVTIVAPAADAKPPALVTITPGLAPPGLRAIGLLEQALRLIEADGEFSPPILEQLSRLIDAVKAEWSDRPLKLPLQRQQSAADAGWPITRAGQASPAVAPARQGAQHSVARSRRSALISAPTG